MVLATHMITGAAAARLFAANPIQAFFIGWLSHYLLDSIVHWDYPLRTYSSETHFPENTTLTLNKYIFLDMGKVLIDVILGFLLVFFAERSFSANDLLLLLAGAVGGTVPDFIQFIYGIFKGKLFGGLQKFHHFMHAKKTLEGRPIIGIVSQVCIIVLVFFVLSFGGL